ncbi:hypothetical protein BB560_005247 [Smittium megazygosporum]|uniref:Uncharacterized protein n=1 Tax=Smittium megazygosporum TaxID=133381 RepID=A0A2T9Z771_9FUNG|nr:hypothetical protein BB560_005247 [Smittium megazygosporum]
MLVKYNKSWERVNQDDVGSRSQCETAATNYLKAVCSLSHQRKIWIKIAQGADCPVDALFFDINTKVCKERVKVRTGHPSGVEGKFGAEVVSRFDKIMTRPSISEGFRFTHDILPHLGNAKHTASVSDVYCETTIKTIISLFPPAVSVKPGPNKNPETKPAHKPTPKPKCDEEEIVIKVHEKEKVSSSKSGTKIDIDVNITDKHKSKPAPPPSAPPKPEKKHEQCTKISVRESNDFWSAPWADQKSLLVIKPNEGFGTYKETKAMWEDEEHTQHFNHSLFNEQAEREESNEVKAEKRSRHMQHSDHMVSASAGVARAFDYMTLDKDRKGHKLSKSGKKEHFHDRSHYHHQHEHQEDAKTKSARTYEHKHMTNFRHLHSGDPDKARTEAFEHRSFNYAFKGGSSFDPEKIMMSSSKNKIKFEDEIKASFQNLPMNDTFKFAQNIKWETDFPTKPNFNVFK